LEADPLLEDPMMHQLALFSAYLFTRFQTTYAY
jgi:hypothetical protein